jgi:hypothetical protein
MHVDDLELSKTRISREESSTAPYEGAVFGEVDQGATARPPTSYANDVERANILLRWLVRLAETNDGNPLARGGHRQRLALDTRVGWKRRVGQMGHREGPGVPQAGLRHAGNLTGFAPGIAGAN